MSLAGLRMLVTRTASDSGTVVERLQRMGAVVVGVPAIRLVPSAHPAAFDAALREAPGFAWVVFTSPHGVEAALARCAELGVRWPPGTRVAAVGASTAAAAGTAGLHVAFTPARYTTDELATSLPDVAGRRVLLLRARDGNPNLAAGLRSRGAQVHDVEAYATEPDPALAEALHGLGPVDWLLLASPSAVEALETLAPAGLLERLKQDAMAACIGPVTAKAARGAGYRIGAVATTHTIEGLLASIQEATLHG